MYASTQFDKMNRDKIWSKVMTSTVSLWFEKTHGILEDSRVKLRDISTHVNEAWNVRNLKHSDCTSLFSHAFESILTNGWENNFRDCIVFRRRHAIGGTDLFRRVTRNLLILGWPSYSSRRDPWRRCQRTSGSTSHVFWKKIITWKYNSEGGGRSAANWFSFRLKK